jgi:hypothetical protein
MNLIKEQIAFKIVTLLLAFTLLVPSVVKFSHVFTHHQHEICNGEYQTHLHKTDIDCNFYKFKLNTPFTLDDVVYEFTMVDNNHLVSSSVYSFLSDFQRLHFSLRGPPQINLT